MTGKKNFCLGTLESLASSRQREGLCILKTSIPLAVRIGSSRSLIRDLASGEADAVFAAEIPEMPGFFRVTAYEERVLLISSPVHPVLTPEDLKGLPLVGFPTGCRYRKHLEDWLKESGRTPGKTVELTDYRAIFNAVSEGCGYAAVPESLLLQKRKEQFFSVPLSGEFGKLPVHFAWSKEADRKAVSLIRETFCF